MNLSETSATSSYRSSSFAMPSLSPAASIRKPKRPSSALSLSLSSASSSTSSLTSSAPTTPTSSTTAPTTTNAAARPKIFVCAVPGCRKPFSKKWNMQAHMRLHTGSTPFACRLGCGASYMWMSSRKGHELNRCRLAAFIPSELNPSKRPSRYRQKPKSSPSSNSSSNSNSKRQIQQHQQGKREQVYAQVHQNHINNVNVGFSGQHRFEHQYQNQQQQQQFQYNHLPPQQQVRHLHYDQYVTEAQAPGTAVSTMSHNNVPQLSYDHLATPAPIPAIVKKEPSIAFNTLPVGVHVGHQPVLEAVPLRPQTATPADFHVPKRHRLSNAESTSLRELDNMSFTSDVTLPSPRIRRQDEIGKQARDGDKEEEIEKVNVDKEVDLEVEVEEKLLTDVMHARDDVLEDVCLPERDNFSEEFLESLFN